MKQQRKHAQAMKLLGDAVTLHNRGRLDEADTLYLRVLRDLPGQPDALHLRALIAALKGDYALSAKLAEMAIVAAPQVANFHNTAGHALRKLGRLQEAKGRLVQAVKLAPSFALALHNLALVFDDLGDLPAARDANRKARECEPANGEFLAHALRLSVIDDADLASAEQYAEQAIVDTPESVDAWITLGNVRDRRWDDAGAEAAFDHAARIEPVSEAGTLALAGFLASRQRLKEAEAHYRAWLAGHPRSAAARFGLAGVLLAQGEFAPGWQSYESRWELPEHTSSRYIAAPQWQGESAERLLLYYEQGLGDTIQMLRFIPRVLQRAVGQITLLVQAPLARVAESVCADPRLRVVTELATNIQFDYACPLMSLPGVLGADSPGSLAMEGPYLRASATRQADFREVLSALPGRKLGLIWQGGKAGFANQRRTVPAEDFLPLLEREDCSVVSLQVGAPPRLAGRSLFDLAAGIDDFYDLAAAMACLDAVVSVDTGPAHLAGALGIPCFTLIPWLHDWRWGMAGGESIWYSGMRLIRQLPGESWARPMAELLAALDRAESR